MVLVSMKIFIYKKILEIIPIFKTKRYNFKSVHFIQYSIMPSHNTLLTSNDPLWLILYPPHDPGPQSGKDLKLITVGIYLKIGEA